jgi:multidrug efflux pump subunit AcrB/outer membrane protein TolC
MSTARFALKNYRFILVVLVAGLALGVLGFLQMPRQEDPVMGAYWATVTVVYPGATAEEVEDRVLEPLEESIHELEEVELIEGTALESVALVSVEFREDVDLEDAYDKMLRQVNQTRDEMPAAVTEITTRQNEPSNVVVLQIAVHGAGSSAEELRTWAEKLEERLRRLPDAKAVAIEGAREQEIHVLADAGRLAEAGLSLGALSDALAVAGGDIPGGSVRSGSRRLSVKPGSRFETPQEIGAAVLRTVDGRPVRVRDVAEVRWGDQDPRHLTRHDGEPAALVTVTLKEGRNVFHLADDARRELEEFRRDLPPGIAASVQLDQSADVARRLGGFWLSLLQGGAIIALFVVVIAGLRSAIVVLSAMLLSVGLSFWLLNAQGVALQQMSIAGMVVVLGLLVDNAIVVVEAIQQARARGWSAARAAVAGTDRVAGAVSASTATTVAAFVPMFLTAGSVGEFTRDIPRVVGLVLLVSLVVALFVTPLLGSRLFASGRAATDRGLTNWLNRNLTQPRYQRSLRAVLRRPWAALALVVLVGLGATSLMPLVGMNFFPAAEKPVFLVRVQAPEGTALAATSERVQRVEEYLAAQPEVVNVAANIGAPNPLMYYNQLPWPDASNRAELVVTVDPATTRQVPDLARRLRDAFADDPSMVVEAKVLMQGPPVGLPVSLELRGEDLSRLRAHADRLEAELRRIPGAVNISHDLRPGPARLDLEVDAVTANKLGLSRLAVAREVRAALAGEVATTLRRGDTDHDVVVRVAPEGDESLSDLERVRLPLPGGGSVPLEQLTAPRLTPTYAAIHRVDLERAVILGSDVDGRLASEVMADLLPHVEDLELAPGESWRVIGEDEERDRAFLSMLQNVIVAMALIYGILVLQFRSFRQPLVIFTSIPVALGGSVLGLLVGGWPFGFTAFIGLLALTGIVVNNAIVLVDVINRLRTEGRDLATAIVEGASSRLQPILLTTLTTIAGLLPLTLSGDSMWGPMGWVIIGGLVVSTAVTLLMVPALYFLMERRAAAVLETPAGSGAVDGAGRGPAFVTSLAAFLIVGFASLAVIAPTNAFADPATRETISLRAAVERAVAVNPDLAARRADADVAAAELSLARSERWPQLGLTLDYLVTEDPAAIFGQTLAGGGNPFAVDLDDPIEALRAAASARWVLWDFGRSGRIAAAEGGRSAADHRVEAARRTLELRVIQAYFALIRADEEIRVNEASLDLVRREIVDARARAEAGRGVEADVLGLEARAAGIEVELSAARGNAVRSRALLAELLGLAGNEELHPRRDERTPEVTVSDPAQLATMALNGRPEARAAREGAAASQALARASARARWPRLVAQGRYASTSPEGDLRRETNFAEAAVGVSWDLFAGGALAAQSHRAEARARRGEHEQDAVLLRIRRDAVDAWTRYETARSADRAARLQVAAAREAYRIVQLRYREGRDSFSRYLAAETALTDAETARVRAATSLEVARAQVRWASGEPLLGVVSGWPETR